MALALVRLLQPAPRIPVEVWVAGVFAVALPISASLALVRTPSLLELARRADRQFALRERVSTALELASSAAYEGARGEVASALLDDAARHASAIDPRRLVPIRFPRVGWWAVALAALGVSFHFGVPQRFSGQPGVSTEAATPLTAEERGRTVTNLRRAVELLGSEAEERKDPYLQALAQSFDDLSRRVASGALDRAATQRELDRLLEHVGRAYEGEVSPFGEAPSARATPNAGASSPASSPPSDTADEGRNLGAEAGTLDRGRPKAANSPSPSLDDLLGELAQVDARLQEAKKGREANRGRVTAVDIQEFGPYINPESLERLRREREQREQQAQAGRPIGAAQEADKGPGDLAGEGIQPLAGKGASTVAEDDTQREQVLLPEREASAGERIRVESPPDTQASNVADGPRPSGEAWRVSREGELRRDQLGPRERAIASRYFAKGKPAVPTAP